MKTTRVTFLLVALALSLSTCGLAQSNAASDYKTQHKAAEKYQKDLMKQRRKQQKEEAKAARAYRKQHPETNAH